MRFLLFLHILVFSLSSIGQIKDDFSDGDLSINPKWQGDLDKFKMENEALRSNSSIVNDNFFLSTNSTFAISAQWEILVNLKFSTSSKNLVNFYVISDSLKLENASNGYFLQLGGAGDKISFVKVKDGIPLELFSSVDGTIKSGSSNTRIKILRDQDTIFHIHVDYTGGTNYSLVGSIKDKDVLTSSYSGINIKQSTASFFNKHFFDDFYAGPIIQDKEPPVLVGLNQLSLNKVQLFFDEDLDSLSAVNVVSYTLNNGIGNPVFSGLANKREVELTFSNDLGNPQNYQLIIENIKDLEGNILDTTLAFVSLVAFSPKANELLITELLPIPEPAVSLPKGEFVELYNNTTEPLSFLGLKIEDLTSFRELPVGVLLSKEYVILCNVEDSLAFSAFGKVLTVSGLPSLNNSSDRIRITNTAEEVIHEVNYSNSIYPPEKSLGWSLEMMDVENPCHFYGNWEASNSTLGGTPGRENSVKRQNPDNIAPILSSIYPISDKTVSLTFDESLLGSIVINNASFKIVETNEMPDSIAYTDDLNRFFLTFSNTFQKGEKHSLEYAGGEDCAGNQVRLDTITFGLPSSIKPGDLLFNEILIEPYAGGEEFIEIFNTTDSFLDLKDLKIGKKIDGKYEEVEFVSLNGRLIAPRSFVVLTKDPSKVFSFYTKKDSLTFFKTMALPSFNNSSMKVVLLNLVNEVVDAVYYDSKWHFELIGETKGVSLERISRTLPNNSYNWTSAASNVGFGTPGVENSQSRVIGKTDSEIYLESKSFSPNGDGYLDVLLINYNMAAANTTANVYVFNEQGALIKQIANNETLSSSGIISWDGEKEIGGKANIGIYVLLFEYFTPDGQVEKKKLSCALVL